MTGTTRGKRELQEHARMLTEYYLMHGYDLRTGIPTRERLETLGLKFVPDELETHGPYPDWDGPQLWRLKDYPHGGHL